MTDGPRVVLDIQATQSIQHGARGIARYVAEHADAVWRLEPELVQAFLLNPRFMVPAAAERFLGSERLRWLSRADPSLRRGPLVYHVMSPFELGIPLEEIWPMAVRRPDVRLAVTLYDLIPLIFEEIYLEDPLMRARYMSRLQLIRSADLVMAISESTGRDAIERLGIDPARLHVIHAGAVDDFRPSSRPPDAVMEDLRVALPALRPGFFLYTGGVDFRKNMEGLIRAYGALPPALRHEHQLVIACRMRPEHREHFGAIAGESGSRDDVLLTDFVPDEVLRGLYQTTRLFVFPSLYEGSGLPILEAARCGAPVAASRVASLPELAPEAGLFDPTEPAEITAVLRRAAEEPAFVEELRGASAEAVRERTWERTAELTVAAYRDRWPARPGRPRQRRRLALVTVYPPEGSGIAVYNVALLAQLVERCDVELFVGGEVSEYSPPPDPRCAIHPARALEQRATLVGFDSVVHCVGNNALHRFVLEAMRKVPGDAYCHDVRLVRYYAATEPDLGAALRAAYPGRFHHENGAPLGFAEAERLGAWMLREVIELSDRILVHSRFAQDVVRLEAALAGVPADVRVVPFGFPAPQRERRRRPAPSPDPLLVSFGLVDPVKRTDLLVEALPRIAARRPGTRLALVGPVTDDEARRLRALARAHGVEERLEITGQVDHEGYHRYLGEADLAIQLRAFSQGEASLTVAETMAYGIPTVVTGAGWMGELPDAAALGLGPRADAGELAAAVESLLDDAVRWRAMGIAAAEHARANSFAATADALLNLVDSGVAAPS